MWYAVVDIVTGLYMASGVTTTQDGYPRTKVMLALEPGTAWGCGDTEEEAIKRATASAERFRATEFYKSKVTT